MKYLAQIARAIGQTIAVILMVVVVLVFILSLSGCGTASDDDDQCKDQYSTASTEVGASGLLLEPAQHMYVTFPQIESFYVEVENCMGVIATGPTVVFTSFSECKEVLGLNCEGLGGNLGQYSAGVQLVLMNTDEHVFERNCETDEGTLKHEFVHHLLWLSENNISHDSPFFGECVN